MWVGLEVRSRTQDAIEGIRGRPPRVGLRSEVPTTEPGRGAPGPRSGPTPRRWPIVRPEGPRTLQPPQRSRLQGAGSVRLPSHGIKHGILMRIVAPDPSSVRRECRGNGPETGTRSVRSRPATRPKKETTRLDAPVRMAPRRPVAAVEGARARSRGARHAAHQQRRSAAQPELTPDWAPEQLREVAERCLQHEPVTDRKGNPTGEYSFNVGGALTLQRLRGKHLGMFRASGRRRGRGGAGPDHRARHCPSSRFRPLTTSRRCWPRHATRARGAGADPASRISSPRS